ncbi:addiction module toxin RelE [Kineobactrum sediminis]|uniref:Addiction module toxin RelE n=1 Tax=Kineobactrum sediminis TaxID=1905677 RepID=A0A2N5XXS5_9GAMM|nr:transposase [Kineobactrum sediminis]PLW80950.1 addiction module toxin RelE [Kineobactrum sediminis]
MARPLRIEFTNALYHVTSRGDRQERIFEDNGDRFMFLALLGEVIERHNWVCHAYCLMTNHYHLVVATPDANLSRGMRQLNGMFTQASNRRHERTGHVFQGRFKSILVDKNSYLLELARYVVLNPVRAQVVNYPGEWPWSSYRAMVGGVSTPDWLTTDWVLAQFGTERNQARQRYRRFVSEGKVKESVWSSLKQQIYLGDEGFVEDAQAQALGNVDKFSIPKVQRSGPVPSLAEFEQSCDTRNNAMTAAYATGRYSYRTIAEHFGVHPATVGRVVRGV